MKRSDRIITIMLLGGMALLTRHSTVMAGVLLIVSAICVLAVLYIRLMRDVYREEADEEADRMAELRYQEMLDHTEYRVWWQSYVGLGKGYDHDCHD